MEESQKMPSSEPVAPYEFEREVKTSPKWQAILVVTLSVLVTGVLVAGAAFALVVGPAPKHRGPARLQVAPTYSIEPVETSEPTLTPDDHNVVVPPMAVKPKPKPKPPGTSFPKPSFKPHFGHGDDEHEGADD